MPQSTDIDVADEAYERLNRAFFGQGDWDAFFELVADEVDFAQPVNPGAGWSHGSEGRQRMEAFFRQFGGENVMTRVERTGRTVAGDTVIYEDEGWGDIAGEPYHARHALFLTVRDGKLVGFREYIAQEPPQD